TLEYVKILQRLAGEAAFSASKALALELRPLDQIADVRRALAFTAEARRLLDERADVGVRGARDVRPHAAAALRGAALQPQELREVLTTLRASGFLRKLIARLEDSYPLFKELGQDLPTRPALEGRIEESISEEGAVLDGASPDLRRIRAELRGAQARLQERLQTLVNEFRSALQEPIITMRSDRYVLPVRAEARGQVRGIVHDQSGSGATVFVEPLVIVEMNNHLRELQLREREEIERILVELSEQVGQDAPYVTLAVELLAELDLQLAKARYAGLINASLPAVNTAGKLVLRQARHPLLTGRVVPIDFHLGDGLTMVVITGPNTGGKTVALKTVGLLALMAQSGLHIPAEDGSELPVFSDVFADIGDEQSIEQSLSTFSSHLTRIIEILAQARPGSLVLLDELGAGTDPSEGSALARAILAHLLEQRIATIATTHYSELKVFAHERPDVANASVEFDVETLSPTYRLSIGLPGRSNALAIAGRLGLPAAIITRARDELGSTGVEMESLLEGLQAERRAAADERYRLSMERAEAEHLRGAMEQRRDELEEERLRILNGARAQARRELESVQAEVARLRKAADKPRHTEEQLDALRQRLRALDERTAPVAPRRPRRTAAPAGEAETVAPGPVAVGDTVRIRSMGQRGEVAALLEGRGEAEVRLGALKMRVPLADLERLSNRQARAQEAPALTLPPLTDRQPPDMQLDVRGWRVEAMLTELDQYLQDAYLTGMPSVRILHGKGTGALRQAVREQLAREPFVSDYASAPNAEGGDGVTVVTFAQ
ncbi:MAG TPA: endonuclease MutS2, partial [Ktedonobacterales bacterium]|nr:endonuclease MutS2 [Ktedonobacterales bacterium]